MDYDAPTSLGLMLAVMGTVLLAASLRVASVARSYRRHMENILSLAHQSLDPLDLPARAWPDLEAGGWRSLRWEGRWFGQPVQGQLANTTRTGYLRSQPLRFDVHSGDEVELRVEMTHGVPWGEHRLFADHLARVFVLLLEMRLHARTEALSAALAERARLSLYLQHDMRNLAQWVLWVGADFAAGKEEDKLHAAARRLQTNAPLACERAERLIAALGRQYQTEQAGAVDLREAVARAARLAGVEPAIEGEACAWIAPHLLARALDNLFTNLAQVWREKADIHLQFQLRVDAGQAVLTFMSPWLSDMPAPPPEKLFEPFASGRPGGLGLGLYQARRSLREAGGDVKAQTGSGGISFLLNLPVPRP